MPISRRPHNSRRHGTLRRRGTWAAVVLALACGGLLIGMIVRGMMQDPGRRGQDLPEDAVTVPTPPNVAAPTGQQPDLAGAMENARLDLLDRVNRTRKIGELFLRRTEPIAERRYAIEQPRALLFLEDGRTVHVQADGGRMYIPEATGQPESGRLDGNVIVRIFDARPDGSRVDPEVDEPSGTLRTESLSFDRTLGHLEAPGEVVITSTMLDLHVNGMTAVLNESRQRVERLVTENGREMVLRPQEREDEPEAPAQATRPPGARPGGARPGPAAPAPAPPPPVELRYSIALEDDVVMMQEGRRIAADTFDGWVRLIDGALPPDAIAPVRIARPEEAEEEQEPAPAAARDRQGETEAARPGKVRAGSEEQREGAVSPSPEPLAEASTEPTDEVRINWSGRMVIVLEGETPTALQQDHVAMRFSAREGGRVMFSDEQSGARGFMPRLDYFATTRRLSFTGEAPDSVEVALSNAGLIRGGRIDSDLGTGFIEVIGPTSAELVERGAMQPFVISAQERSAFILWMDDGALTGDLRQATFTGDVRMTSADGAASAGFARAEFAKLAAARGGGSSLVRVVLEDDAEMHAGEAGRMHGDRIDIALRASGEDSRPHPDRITVTGGASAQRDAERIESEFLEWHLGMGEDGKVRLSGALARGSVVFTNEEDGLRAAADELRLAAGTSGEEIEEVHLTGQVELVRSEQGAGGEAVSRITGERARLDGTGRALEMIGAGQFTHHENGELRLSATWERSMRFDDAAGSIHCEGDAEAISTPALLVRERAAGDTIIVHLTPADGGEGAGDAKREIVKARAMAGEGGERASFESRRYVLDEEAPEGRRLEQLVYLEGAEIDADNEGGTLDVPSAGRLVLVDRRPESEGEVGAGVQEPGAAEVASGPESPLGRGDSLFEWNGSLAFDRRSGLMTMLRGVQGTHQRLQDGEVTGIVCERLTARTTPAPEGVGLAADGLSESRLALLSLRAEGSVHLSSGPARTPEQPLPPLTELTADLVEYDAELGTVEASAAGDNIVTIITPGVAAPTMAKALRWNLLTGEINITRPAPIVAPR